MLHRSPSSSKIVVYISYWVDLLFVSSSKMSNLIVFEKHKQSEANLVYKSNVDFLQDKVVVKI